MGPRILAAMARAPIRTPRPPLAPGVLLALALVAAPAPAQTETFVLEGSGDAPRAWRSVAEEAPTGDAAIIAQARRSLAADDPRAARRQLDEWLRRNEGGTSPLLPEALLLRGDALLAIGWEFKALYDYENLIRSYPQSEQFVPAIQRELDIALAYVGGLRKRFLGFRVIEANDIAVELLIRVQERLPGSQLAERASIELADFYYREREMRLARDAYDLYLANFPDGPNRLHAERRLIFADVARFKGPRYDSSGLLDARVRIRNFERRYPAEAERSGINEGLVARIDESLAAQLLENASWYRRQGDGPAERLTLERLALRFPATLAAQRAIARLEEAGWRALSTRATPERTARRPRRRTPSRTPSRRRPAPRATGTTGTGRARRDPALARRRRGRARARRAGRRLLQRSAPGLRAGVLLPDGHPHRGRAGLRERDVRPRPRVDAHGTPSSRRSTGPRPWRVVSPSDADTVLRGSITDAALRKLTTSGDTGLVQEMAYQLTVTFEWKDNGSGEVLVARSNFRAGESFVPAQSAGERIETGRFAAVDQLASDIVAELRTSW